MAQDRLQYIFDLINGKNTLGPEFDKMQKKAKKFQDTMTKVTKTAAVAFTGLGATIAGTLTVASKFEDISVSFEVLTGSVKVATDAMNELKTLSASTPFQFADIAKAGKQLLAFGYEADTLVGHLTKIGNVAAAAGAPLGEVATIFGQVAAAGKLTGERLLQFQERAIPIGPAIAKTMGIAEDAVKDMVSTGAVDLKVFEAAFASLSAEGGVAFKGMEKLSQTLSGRISTLADNFMLLAADVGNVFLPVAKDAVIWLTELIKLVRDNKALVKWGAIILGIATAVTGAVTSIGALVIGIVSLKIAWAAAMIAMGGATAAFTTVLAASGIGLLIIGISVAVYKLATDWDNSVKQMSAIWTGFSNLVKDVGKSMIYFMIRQWAEFFKSFETMVYNMRAKWEGLTQLFTDTGKLISGIFKGITSFSMDEVKKSIAEFAVSTVVNLEKTKEKIAENEKSYEKFKATLKEKFKTKPIELNIDWPKTDAIPKITVPVEFEQPRDMEWYEGIQNMGTLIKAGWDKGGLTGSVQMLGKIGEFTASKIGKNLGDAWKKTDFKKAFDGVGTKFLGALSQGKEGAKTLVKDIMVSGATAMFGPIGKAVGPIMDLMTMSSDQLKDTIKQFAEALPEMVNQIADNIPVIIEALIRAIPRVVEGFARFSAEKFSNPLFWAKIMEVFAVEMIKAGPNIIASYVKGMRDGLKDGIIGAFKEAFEKLRDFFKKIFQFDGGGTGVVEKFLGFDFPFLKFAKGGKIGGHAKINGDSDLNDTVPALLSPGEVVVPRSVVNQGTVGGVVDYLQSVGAPIKKYGFGSFVGGFVNSVVSAASSATGSILGGIGSTFGLDGVLSGLPLVGPAYDKFQDEVIKPVIELIKAGTIPKELLEIVKALYKLGAKINVPNLIKDPKGEVKNAVLGVRDVFKPGFMKLMKPLATGGMLQVPGNAGIDQYPAMLAPGELVVDRSTSSKLKDFLNNSGSGSSAERILLEILAAIKTPQKISTSLEVSGESLANVILELNRNNSRLTA